MSKQDDFNIVQRAVSKGLITNEQLQKAIQFQKANQQFTLLQILLNYKQLTTQSIQQLVNETKLGQSTQQNPQPKFSQSGFSQFKQKNHFLHYEIKDKLGQGGMGVVYKAIDTKLRRVVALKLMLHNDSPKAAKRFIREASVTARLKHPNIVDVLEYGDKPYCFFTMEYIEGTTFKDFLRQDEIELSQHIQIIQKMATALFEVHSQGVVHRDIKPANIMIDGQQNPKLMDFGLAKVSDEHGLTKTGNVIGTLRYMSPEQANGEKVDKYSDIYSLGASLYEVLTGRPPFISQTSVNLVMQIIETEPVKPRVINPGIPPELEAICLKCLEKAPQSRYRTAKALAKDLQNFLENRPVSAKPPTIWKRGYKFVSRHRYAVISFAAIYFVIFISAIFSIVQWKKAESEKLVAIEERTQKSTLARSKTISLCKVAMAQGAKAHYEKRWRDCGALMGTSLEYIKNLEGPDVDILRKKAKGYIRSCVRDIAIISQRFNSTKSIFYCKVSFSVDNSLIALFSHSQGFISKNILRLFTISGEHLHDLSGYSQVLKQLVFSPNSKYFAAKGGNTATIWDVQSGDIVATFDENVVKSIDFTEDSRYFLLHTKEKINIWDTAQHKFVGELGEKVKKASFVGKTQVFFANGNKAIVQDSMSGKVVHEFSHEEEIKDTAVSKDRTLLASLSQKEFRVWNAKNGRSVLKKRKSGNKIKIGLSGVAVIDTTELMLFNLEGKKLKKLKFNRAISEVDFAFGGNVLAITSDEQHVYLWGIREKRWLCAPATPDKISDPPKYTPAKSFTGFTQYLHESGAVTNTVERKIATRGGSHLIIIWNMDNGKEEQRIGFYDRIMQHIFSPDGKLLIVATLYEVFILNTHNGRLLERINLGRPDDKKPVLGGFGNFISSIAISPDSSILAIARVKEVTLRRIDGNTELANLNHEKFSFGKVLFSPDGKNLLTTAFSAGKKFLIWDVSNQKILQEIDTKDHCVSIDYSLDGEFVCIGTYSGVYLYNSKTGELLQQIPARRGSGVVFSKSGKFLFYSDNGRINIFDILYQKSSLFSGGKSAYSSENYLIAGSGSGTSVLDIQNLESSARTEGNYSTNNKTAFFPGSKKLFTRVEKDVVIWNTDGKKILSSSHDHITNVVINNDGTKICVISWKKVEIVDVSTGKTIATMEKETKNGGATAAFCPDNHSIVVGRGTNIYLWDFIKDKTFKLSNEFGATHSIEVSSTNKLLTGSGYGSGNKSGVVTLWDLSKKKLLDSSVKHPSGSVRTMFHPQKNIIMSFSFSLAVLQDAKTYKIINKFLLASPNVSPNGKYLIGNRKSKLLVYNLENGKVHELENISQAPFTKTTFSRNSKYLFCDYSEGPAILWDLEMKSPLKTIYKPTTYSTHFVEFSPDNSILLNKWSGRETVSLSKIEWNVKRDKEYVRPRWTKQFLPSDPQKYQKESIFDFRTDIPGWLIEYNLAATPKLFTQYLFERSVSQVLSINKFEIPPVLWETKYKAHLGSKE
ncbi:protein kinase [Candidatus Uabimicrobium sp. HlEnr_7]|uniref:protein kinase domain-containing protein n=1 Tax=Candidatus Uabimicrobium helgolandensis TaxID=3095367 RepID=UPI00355810A9